MTEHFERQAERNKKRNDEDYDEGKFMIIWEKLICILFREGGAQGTVVLRTNETIDVYRSKMAFFKGAWQKVTVLSRPLALGLKLALIRTLNWGTLRLRIAGGSKNTSFQSWKNKK